MAFDYPEKKLWDQPTVWNKGVKTDRPRMAISLRQRTPGVGDDKFDLDRIIDSKMGREIVLDFAPFILHNEMDPELLTYYEHMGNGLKKELHQSDDDDEKWATFTPLSAYKEENKCRKYPFMFVLHGAGMPIGWEECSGFTKVAARDEIILCFPQNQDVDNIMRIFEEIKKTYPIDESRVYCTGYSLGGSQTNAMIFAHPEILAAAAPCGSLAGPFSILGITDEQIANVAEKRLPVMTVSGQNEAMYLFPYYEDAGKRGMWAHGLEDLFGKTPTAEGKIESLNIRLKSGNCSPVTLEDAMKSAQSTDKAERAVGAPGAKYTTEVILDTEHYIATYTDSFGDDTVKIVAIENFPHWPSPTMAELIWDFFKHYSRDLSTGRLVDDRK